GIPVRLGVRVLSGRSRGVPHDTARRAAGCGDHEHGAGQAGDAPVLRRRGRPRRRRARLGARRHLERADARAEHGLVRHVHRPARQRVRALADRPVGLDVGASAGALPVPRLGSVERKLATVLFVDLVDSTSLVTSADPEVVRRRVNRYFERASDCIARHGGTVEKFAGDAVMAAFGVPRSHEDDAVRAVRAALAILDSVHELELEARAGIESGEVVVEDADSTFVTGEAVNVAARLQQSAEPGAIKIGPGARRLTLAEVEVEDAGPVEVRGRGEVWSWRALRVGEGRRRPQARFVGREVELELLRNLYERAVRDRRAHLATVFGDAGVGKSRLVGEFAAGVERATILTGRALAYGEGIGYWPVVSMIKASAGITDDDPAAEAFEKLRVSCESDAV